MLLLNFMESWLEKGDQRRICNSNSKHVNNFCIIIRAYAEKWKLEKPNILHRENLYVPAMPLYAAAIDIGFIGKKCLFTKEEDTAVQAQRVHALSA